MDLEQNIKKTNALFEALKVLKKTIDLDTAIEKGNVIINVYQQLNEWEALIRVRFFIGHWENFDARDSQSRIRYTEETLSLSLEVLKQPHLLTATVLHYLGGLYHDVGNLVQEADCFEKALVIHQSFQKTNNLDVALLYDGMGMNCISRGFYQEAFVFFKKEERILEELLNNFDFDLDSEEVNSWKSQLATSYRHIGHFYIQIGEYREARVFLKKALDIHQTLPKQWQKNKGRVLISMARCYAESGDIKMALLYAQKVLVRRTALLGKSHLKTGDILSIIGYLYTQMKEGQKAIRHIEQALEIYLLHKQEKNPNLGDIYTNLGIAYQKDEKALKYFQKVLDNRQSLYGEQHPITTEAYNNIGNYYIGINQYIEAQRFFEKSLHIRLQSLGKQHPYTAQSYNNLGFVYFFQKNYLDAIHYFHRSLNILCFDFDSEDVYTLPSLKDYTLPEQIFKALHFKAEAFFEYFKYQSHDEKDHHQALKSYERAIRLIDLMKQSFKMDASKLSLSNEIYLNVFEKSLEVTLYDMPSVAYKSMAFTFSEKSKATVLMTSMQDSLAKAVSNIPNRLLKKEKELKIELTLLDKNIQREEAKGVKKDEQLFQKWQNQFFNLHRKYLHLLKKFEEEYPDYYQLKYETKTVTIEEIQQNLTVNQVLISYFVAEDTIYVFVITPEVFEVEEIEKTKEFSDSIRQFLDAIHAHDQAAYLQLAHGLYELLIAPLELHWFDFEVDNPKHLLIIPHAELSYLPFEALISEPTVESSTAYQEVAYLLKQYEISYHYSATLWHYLLSKKGNKADTENSFVGFAPVYEREVRGRRQEVGDNIAEEGVEGALKLAAKEVAQWATRSEALRSDGTWIPLPHSKAEAENIAALFEQKGLGAETYLYENATKEAFQKAVEKSRYLLVAAHGVVNDEQPKLSGLVFYPKMVNEAKISNNEYRTLNNESLIINHQNDCILSMEETYPLNINADLVVLSSCESGIGQFAKGEGMMAVTRGFIHAGARNVIATLFKVYDKPSSLLTQYLFEEILKGKKYIEALRLAKLKLMQQPNIDPKSWCGFVLIGG